LFIIWILIISILISVGMKLKKRWRKERSGTEKLTVKEVVDGDTIVLGNEEIVRYLGIDTPEIGECGAEEARKINEKLVFGKRVKLEKDVTDKDQYGRLLRFVFTEDGEFVNWFLIRNGYAQLLAISPDKKFEKVFLDAQLTAKKENLGIWRECFLKKGGDKRGG